MSAQSRKSFLVRLKGICQGLGPIPIETDYGSAKSEPEIFASAIARAEPWLRPLRLTNYSRDDFPDIPERIISQVPILIQTYELIATQRYGDNLPSEHDLLLARKAILDLLTIFKLPLKELQL